MVSQTFTARPARFANRTVVVTGAASGIGLATAVAFLMEGAAKVCLVDRDERRLELACLAILKHVTTDDRIAGVFVPFICDVSNESEVVSTISKVAEQSNGVIDILVNVAGVDIIADLKNTDFARWQRTLNVNLNSVYLTARAALPFLEKSIPGGSIVNTSSIQANRAFANFSAYAASKSGILGFTRQIASDLSGKNIRVNAVCPGLIETNLTENSLSLESDYLPIEGGCDLTHQEKCDAAHVDKISDADLGTKVDLEVQKNVSEIRSLWHGESKKSLFGTLSSVQVAMPILFLSSAEAGGLTGIELPVDGGFGIKGVCFLKKGNNAKDCETICES